MRRALAALVVLTAAACGSNSGAAPERSYVIGLEVEDDSERYRYVATDEVDIRVGDEVTFELDNTGTLIHDLQVVDPDGNRVGYAEPAAPGAERHRHGAVRRSRLLPPQLPGRQSPDRTRDADLLRGHRSARLKLRNSTVDGTGHPRTRGRARGGRAGRVDLGQAAFRRRRRPRRRRTADRAERPFHEQCAA